MNKKIITIMVIMIFLNFGFAAQSYTEPNFGSLVYGDTEIPRILPRSTWENTDDLKNLLTWYPGEDESPTAPEDEENSPPDYFNIERIIIHDTGCDVNQPGCNDKEKDPVEIVQAIYRYHAATRGWGDIGYHYIIDYWGNIYEGRYGGNGVRGAHTYYDRNCDNFNVGSVGILLMGNYENAELPDIMYQSLNRLVAWVSATNSLDPTKLSHYSEIWHSPKKNGKCDTENSGLTGSYTGPVVVGHGDVEYGNSDPGIVDLTIVRKEAKKMLLTYNNYLFTISDTSKKYTITNGELNPYQGVLSGFSVIALNDNQFSAFINPDFEKLADGTLIKSENRDRIYLIEDQKRRPILSEKLFKIKNYKFENVISLTDRNLAIYPIGDPLTYPDGILIRGSGPEVYLVEDGQRKHITSPALFNNRGYNWDQIVEISDEELLAHPSGESLCFLDGTLLTGISPEVYVVESQKLRWIKTAEIFLSLGYKWQNIIQLSQEEINKYSLGAVIGSTINTITEETQEETQTEEEQTTDSQEPIMKVGIYSFSAGETAKISANGPYEIYENNEFQELKNKDEIFIVTGTTSTDFKLVPKTKDTIFEILTYEDIPNWNKNLNDNLFRGSLKIKYSEKSKQIWVINELGLESYLKGLAEALNDHPIEYIKALVVAARSYSLFHIQNNGKYPGEDFYLKNWSYDQVYKGYGFESRAPNITTAVEETNGIVATFNNKPIRGVYSSDSGGTTRNACDLWGGEFCSPDYDYLKGGIEDPLTTEHTESAIIASHGVGISAVGARELANQGKTYQEILNYYYQGINIEKIY